MSRTWFVTGANSGIGEGIAKAALAAGDRVVATARNMDKLHAAPAQVANSPSCPSSDVDDRIHVDLTPNLWGLSMTAKGRIGGQATAASIPLGTIIHHLDNLFLGEIDVRKGHLVVLADATHAAITLPARAPLPAGFRVPISATFLTLAAGWSSGPMPVGTLGGTPVAVRIEPFAGATYDDLDARIDGPQGTVARLSPGWWSPMAGGRVDVTRGRGSLRFEGYVAGFSHARAGQQALASYAYRLHWRALGDPTVGGGYRYSRQRRAVDGDSLALRLHGPVAYMTFHL